MAFPKRTCTVCEEEFELRPNHPGYANRCVQCNEDAAEDQRASTAGASSFEDSREANAARRQAIKDMLYPGR